MKFYIVERDSTNVSWDEYDSIVVYAKNKKEALQMAIGFYPYFGEKETTVEVIRRDSKPRIVHMSFFAG